MDPAAERIATVDRRAREEVKKAEEYRDKTLSLAASEEEEIRAGAARDARERAEEVRRESEDLTAREAERIVGEAREKASAAVPADRTEALAAAVVKKITESVG